MKTKEELQKANKQAKEYLTNIGLTMLPVGLVGTKVGQALAKGYGKAIGRILFWTVYLADTYRCWPSFVVAQICLEPNSQCDQ